MARKQRGWTLSVLISISVVLASCAAPTSTSGTESAEIWSTSINHDFTTADTQIYQVDNSTVVFVTNHKYNEQYVVELKILGSVAKKIAKYKIYEYNNDVLDLSTTIDEGMKLINSGIIAKNNI